MDATDQNRRSWNAVTAAHNTHKVDQPGYFRAGGSTLFPEEIELLGDIRGQSLLHLQCNCGQDALSLVGLGAVVTGVDISDAAIDFARSLSADSGIPATFERADVYAFFEADAGARFDVVFSSYGVIGWLPDLSLWAQGVARCLKPGGRFVLLEFHPLCWSVGGQGRWVDRYFQPGAIDDPSGVGDYVAKAGEALSPSGFSPGTQGFENPEPAVVYQWTTAQLLQALIDAGLMLTTIQEYPFSNGCCLHEGMVEDSDRRFRHPDSDYDPPLMLGICLHKGRATPESPPQPQFPLST